MEATEQFIGRGVFFRSISRAFSMKSLDCSLSSELRKRSLLLPQCRLQFVGRYPQRHSDRLAPLTNNQLYDRVRCRSLACMKALVRAF